MADLVSSVEAEFSTDFAILQAHQEVAVRAPIHVDMPAAGSFVGTCPGALAALCGTKFADLRVRAERWDGRPAYVPGWEDIDELPFCEVPGAGLLELSGFDPQGIGLDIDGFGRGRLRVYARGRYRYSYGSHTQPEGLAPEEWLFQFFPDPDTASPAAEEPRRLARPSPLDRTPRNAWDATLREWSLTGWDGYLQRYPGYSAIEHALRIGRQPQTRLDLARAAWRQHVYQSWKMEPPTDPLVVELRRGVPSTREPFPSELETAALTDRALVELAGLTGLGQVNLFGDLFQALVNLGLLIPIYRNGTELIVPNPSPGIVWEVLDLPAPERKRVRENIGRYNFGNVADDINNLLTWVPGTRLEVTPRALALRLAATTAEVLGALDFLDVLNSARTDVTSSSSQEEGNASDPADQLMIVTKIETDRGALDG